MVALDRPSGLQVDFGVQVRIKGGVWLVPASEVVKLAPNLLAQRCVACANGREIGNGFSGFPVAALRRASDGVDLRCMAPPLLNVLGVVGTRWSQPGGCQRW